MKVALLIFGLTAFFIANTYHDGKYTQMLKSGKKYYKMAAIGFAGISAYVFMRKYPSHSRSLFSHANGIVKYMPIDKEAGDFLTPFFDLGAAAGAAGTMGGTMGAEQRLRTSGNSNSSTKGAMKRSVSETKKKFVAAQQGWTCGDCQKQLPAWFEVDHKTRLDRGGSNNVDNLVALCRDCHGKKTAFENL
jgi:hypothetical protein